MSESSFTDDLPAELTLAVGASADLPLRGALGSGYGWTCAVEGDAVQAAIVIGTAAAEPATSPPPPAAFAASSLHLSATAPGTARLELRLARAWQPDSPLAVHELLLTVPVPAQ